MQDIARRFRNIQRQRPLEFLLVVGAAAATILVVVCVGCLALALIVGTTLTPPTGATEPAVTQATAAARRTAAPQPTDAAETAASPPLDDASSMAQSPLPTGTPPPTGAPGAPAPTATPSTPTTATTPDTPQPMDLPAAAALLQPLDVPAPDEALELSPTRQLTLSTVIFIENVGQFDDEARFQVRGALGGGLWLTPDALWLTLLEPALPEPATGDPFSLTASLDPLAGASRGVTLKLSFVGANPNPRLVPFGPLDTHVSFFFGNDPADQRADAPAWSGVRYEDLYPGVDLELTSENGEYVQRLVVHPGADLGAVRLRVEGAEALALEPLPAPPPPENGGEVPQVLEEAASPSAAGYYLRLTTALGDLSLPLLPAATPDGSPLPPPAPPAPRLIEGGFVVESPLLPPDAPASLPASLASADEPAHLLYSTLLGRSGNDGSYAIAVDGLGSAYVTGHTYVPAFPLTAGVFDADSGGRYDVLVVKLNAEGAEQQIGMAYVAFLGGSGNETGLAIAVDGAGRAYVTGVTHSPDLPTTPGAFDRTYDGGADAFVVKLAASGAELAYATFLGGRGDEAGLAIAVDDRGNAYVAGATRSANFPVTVGAWDTQGDGGPDGKADAFVVQVNGVGSGLVYATFLGGSDDDVGYALALDDAGRVYVTGATRSADFPATEGSVDADPNGGTDAFVVKLDATGPEQRMEMVYATFLGGSDEDVGYALAVDDAGQAHVAGATRSADFPATAWAFGPAHAGGRDAFVVKLDATGADLAYASFLGGDGDDGGQAIAVDGLGQAYVAGWTQSLPLTETVGGFDASANGGTDAFVVRVDELGTGLAYATLLGGSGQDRVWGLAVDALGSVYLTGLSDSPDLNVARRARPSEAGLWDAFVLKLTVGAPFLDLPVAYANFAQAALGNFGDRGPGRVNSWFDHSYPTHRRNRNLTRWDGLVSALTAASPPRIGENWYDGHGGVDLRREGWDEPVLAAAPGRVIDVVGDCRAGDRACGNYFGNRVWLDHGNGYATVYAHLKTVTATLGTLITDPAAQPLGVMGNTGRSQGAHLHLGLYFDSNGDGRWTRDEVIDPYGWAGARPDPWRGPSRYLWRQPLWTRQLVGAAGARLVSPSGLATATIPAGALPATTLLELWDAPTASLPREAGTTASPDLWRAVGRSFWLLGRRLQADGGPAARWGPAPASLQPITLRVAYRPEDLPHLDPDRLTLYRWDEASRAWTALPTTIETCVAGGACVLTAQTTELGRFDLRAPLLCLADSQEPDDHYAAAQPVLADGRWVRRALDTRKDVDWFRVDLEAGAVYVAQIDELGRGVETLVELRDLDTLALLATSAGYSGGEAPSLKWRARRSGSYLLRVSRAGGGAYGCGATYALGMTQVYALDGVTIIGPDTGLVQTSYTFTATVSPFTARLPITYTWQITGAPLAVHVGGLTDTVAFTWTTPGDHLLRVVAANAEGVVTGAHELLLYGQVEASFTASPTSGPAPLKVAFTNTSAGEYTDSRWDFGDGETSRKEHPTHTYQAAGVYTVTLTVSGPGGRDARTRAAYITVAGAPVPRGEHTIYLPLILRR